MNFDDLDKRMRVFETAHDLCVLPGVWIVARLDGRNFTSLTKRGDGFDPPLEAPFDARFRDAMTAATHHLMTCGFPVVYGYSQSDEISLLLARDAATFGRKERKLNSVLAGEASAALSLRLGTHACLDCRVCRLPRDGEVIDYFRWRAEDALRNALSAHCYWALRREGTGATAATRRLVGLSTSDKNELLFARGTNFNDLPAWHKRGVGLWWETYEKAASDPRTGEARTALRRRVRVEHELPTRDDYAELIRRLMAA